jgi:hypothetical protein
LNLFLQLNGYYSKASSGRFFGKKTGFSTKNEIMANRVLRIHDKYATITERNGWAEDHCKLRSYCQKRVKYE